MNTDAFTSGSAVNSHGWPNKGRRNIFCKTEDFVLLVVPGLSSSSTSPSQAKQSPQRGRWICGTRSCHSVDPILSVQNKNKHLRRRKRVYESFSSRQKSQTFTLTIHWQLANPVKIYHGIIELRHLIDPRRMVLLKERYAEWEGTSAVLLQSGLDEKWWADSLECCCYLRNVQDFLADGKTLCERRFGEPFQGPIIPFGALVEYYPISTRDQSRLHHFGKKVLLEYSLDMR